MDMALATLVPHHILEPSSESVLFFLPILFQHQYLRMIRVLYACEKHMFVGNLCPSTCYIKTILKK